MLKKVLLPPVGMTLKSISLSSITSLSSNVLLVFPSSSIARGCIGDMSPVFGLDDRAVGEDGRLDGLMDAILTSCAAFVF